MCLFIFNRSFTIYEDHHRFHTDKLTRFYRAHFFEAFFFFFSEIKREC